MEIQIFGPTLEVAAESVRVALAGTRAELEILGQDPVRFPAHQSVTLTRGQRFRVGALPDSSTAYLAVEGGFAVPRVYGSRSTYSRAGIGGLNGRVIQDGDSIPLEVPTVRSRGEIRLANDGYLDATGPFRVILGPQRDFFSDEAMALFLSRDYAVTRDADRMGMRLDGPVLEHVRGYNIVSDGIVTGAVQVPGNGLPIILLADHQTTGGYPKLGAVISADIPRLGRLRPGDAKGGRPAQCPGGGASSELASWSPWRRGRQIPGRHTRSSPPNPTHRHHDGDERTTKRCPPLLRIIRGSGSTAASDHPRKRFNRWRAVEAVMTAAVFQSIVSYDDSGKLYSRC